MRTPILFVFTLFLASLGANNFELANLTNNDGLSNSSINTIFQGKNGLMWFGTWDGLNVYNGREFKVYKPLPEDENSISNNIIREIIEEKGDVMWIATDMGINRLDIKSNKFDRFFVDARTRSVTGEHFFLLAKNNLDRIFAAVFEQGLFYFNPKTGQFTKLNSLKNLRAKKIFFDLDDNLWIFTQEKLLYKIVFKKDNQSAPGIESIVPFVHGKNVENVFYHNNNELWFQTSDNRLFSYRISAGTLSEYKGDLNSVGSIRSMLFFNGYELIGSSNGLFRFTDKTGMLEPLQTNVSVLSLWAGTQQIVWVGTDMQGVYQLSPSRENFHNYSSENTTLFGHSAVRTFFEEKDGTLWVGTKGSGIYIFRQSGSSTQLTFAHKFDISGGLLSNSVFTIVPGYGPEYWIGTDGKGLNYYDCRTGQIRNLYIADHLKRNVNLTSVYSVLPADANTLWVGTSGYGMYKLVIDRSTSPYSVKAYSQYVYHQNQSSTISNNIVYSIIRDDDHLWIATRGGGLNRFNIKKESFQTFRFSSDNPGFISSDDILCLYKDHDGVLWAGTSMGLNKLIRFENGKPVFARFTEKDGMPNNTVHGILEDTEHHLWLSTNRGIAKIIPKSNDIRIISYLKKDGLQNNEFSDGAFYKSPYSGNFYFGGISGFNVFNPLEITYSSFVPSLILDAFFVDNVPTNLADLLQTRKMQSTLVLSYRNKSFSFRFIPVDYLSGSKCEISYQIEGYQKDWIQLGTSNTIVITNLPKGNYVLKVRCSNADKIWSDQLYVLPIKMLPPWWASNIAYLCYFILLIGMFFGVWRFMKYQMSVKSAIRMKELDKQKTEEIHQAKLRFFTNIAHEFSNSLTLIYGPCERLLQNHVTDGTTRKYINIIKSNSERMQTLIQQLIDFRKAETGHLRLTIEKVDVPELVKFVLDNFLDILEQKKIRFSLHFHPDAIVWKTDRNSLEKVIFNLVSNAVKYTPADESVEIAVDANSGSLLKIRVTNTGVGIREKYQKTIFDRFEVLERFEKQVSKGLETRNGIGLALCKNIIEVLQGTISVESDGETFTTFVVTLPEQEMSEINDGLPTLQPLLPDQNEVSEYVDQEEDTTDKGIEPVPTAEKHQGLVLVIDDDREIRRFIHDFLAEKYEVAEASNGQEAIGIMKHRIPQIIVCDIIMPVMDGVEFLKIMKSQELTRHIPVILLSSKSTIENQIEGIEVGADAYLGKPFHPRHLEVIIENLLHRNKAILDYSESPYMAVEQFEGKLVRIEDKDLITNVTQIIYQHLDNENLSMEFLSNELAMSKMQLYRKMKDIIGLTPTEYIRSVRLKQAEKLLKTTNKTVQEIMYSCGFNNKTYFYREFAKKYHLTPKEYRNRK